MLNGLTPYIDIFEVKPPGIFLVAAASLWLTDGSVLGRVLEVLIAFAIPIIGVAVTWHLTKKTARPAKLYATAAALCFGILLAAFASLQAGKMYVETFGVFFSVLYIAILIISQPHFEHPDEHKRSRTIRMILAGICLAGAIGFKEPFFLITLACALLLCKSKRAFLWGFVYPLCTGAILGTVILIPLGLLGPYFTEYLPYILNDHKTIVDIGVGLPPLWFRGLQIHLVIARLADLSMLFAATIVALWIVLLGNAFTQKRRWAALLRVLAILYLTVLAVEIGAHNAHPEAAAVPVYLAIFLAFAQSYASGEMRNRMVASIAALIILATLFQAFPQTWDEKDLALANDTKILAQVIDRVMDDCSIDRYLQISVFQEPFYGYMKHSPLPAGLIGTDSGKNLEIPLFHAMFEESYRNADLIIRKKGGNASLEMYQYIQEHFTEEPRTCADTTYVPDHVKLLFSSQ